MTRQTDGLTLAYYRGAAIGLLLALLILPFYKAARWFWRWIAY